MTIFRVCAATTDNFGRREVVNFFQSQVEANFTKSRKKMVKGIRLKIKGILYNIFSYCHLLVTVIITISVRMPKSSKWI